MPRDLSPIELAKYRLEKAKEDLLTAKMSLEGGMLRGSVNRSYYAVFHAARALLALEGADYKKHVGVIAHFHREYVKTGLFDKTHGETISNAFVIRNEADYDDFYVLPKEDAVEQLINAERFTDAVENYIKSQV